QHERDLLRRPQSLEAGNHAAAQGGVGGQLRLAGSPSETLGAAMGSQRPIAVPVAIGPDFPADRRWRTPDLAGDRSHRPVELETDADLDALVDAQPQRRRLTLGHGQTLAFGHAATSAVLARVVETARAPRLAQRDGDPAHRGVP